MTGVRWFDALDVSLATPHERLMRLVRAAAAAFDSQAGLLHASKLAPWRSALAAGTCSICSKPLEDF